MIKKFSAVHFTGLGVEVSIGHKTACELIEQHLARKVANAIVEANLVTKEVTDIRYGGEARFIECRLEVWVGTMSDMQEHIEKAARKLLERGFI
jgi:hypothetical protein